MLLLFKGDNQDLELYLNLNIQFLHVWASAPRILCNDCVVKSTHLEAVKVKNTSLAYMNKGEVEIKLGIKLVAFSCDILSRNTAMTGGSGG